VKDLYGKLAFVAGGTSGVGLAVVKALAAAGMKVAIGCAEEGVLRSVLQLTDENPQFSLFPMQVDLMDSRAVSQAAAEAQRLLGHVQIVCNCVHACPDGVPGESVDLEQADRFLALNFSSVVNAVTAFLPAMKAHGEGGHLLNLASPSSFLAAVPCAPYVASMFAVRAMTETLRLSVGRFGIAVSLLCVPDDTWKEPPGFERELLQGLRAERRFICAPASLMSPLRALHEEIAAAFPDTPPDPRRAALERRRRAASKGA
jgi:NAD(P)-dependent dehydrogenase (short-subunit alcohol dehydrogenase family)